ncbi:hypothetical protein E8E13_006753 [Curvularia kusanoi]|uniref:Uncharacterized protein n=1 Tax=Curvularia kusanoi TaxID=90978 RepID=A0A9P4T9W5_CURKU|nr:hypothetical protein E8E13_006753 [Curvularia kusanoi]
MAYYRVVRGDDHRYPRWTSTTYEDAYAEETASSFVNKETAQTSTYYIPVVPDIGPPPPPPTSSTSTMSGGPPNEDSNRSGSPPYVGSRPWRASTYDDDTPSSSLPTPTTSSTTSWEHYSLVTSSSSTISTPPTPPAGDALPPTSTSSVVSGLPDHQANNGPNRTPMYAAAGIAPVVVVVVGFVIFFFFLRKRRRQRQAVHEHGHVEEMKKHPKPLAMPYIAPITPPSPPPAVLSQHSLSTPSSYHPPTASSSQPIILGPIPSSNNGAYLTGMDTSDVISMTSAGGMSRQGTIVDRDPFADGRSLEEAPPPYRPSSLPPVSIASTSRNSSLRLAAPPNLGSTTQLIENPFGDPEDDEVSQMSGPTLGRTSTAMSDVSELSYQLDPVVSRSPFS